MFKVKTALNLILTLTFRPH